MVTARPSHLNRKQRKELARRLRVEDPGLTVLHPHPEAAHTNVQRTKPTCGFKWLTARGRRLPCSSKLAVEQAEAAGRVEKEPKQEKGASAHLLTAIVDGFLFHHFEEQVGSGTTNELLGDLELLLDRALTGLYLTSP